MRYILFVLIILAYSGCAQKPPAEQDFNYQQQLTAVQQLDSWHINARISITTPQDSVTATLNWEKRKDYQLLELTGTLGQTYATLEIDSNKSTLLVRDKPPVTTLDVESLMMNELGFVLPISLLTNWVRAIPVDSEADNINVDEQGFIRHMNFQDWRVQYRKYQQYPNINTLLLPSRLTLTNDSETLKLAIKTWRTL